MVRRALFLGFSLLSLGVEASQYSKGVLYRKCGKFILNQVDIVETSARKIQTLQKEMDSDSISVGLSFLSNMRLQASHTELEARLDGCVKSVILCQKALNRAYDETEKDPTASLELLSAKMKFEIVHLEYALGNVRRYATDFVTYGQRLTEIETALDELHQKSKACQKEDPIYDLKNESFRVQELNFQSERNKCDKFIFSSKIKLEEALNALISENSSYKEPQQKEPDAA